MVRPARGDITVGSYWKRRADGVILVVLRIGAAGYARNFVVGRLPDGHQVTMTEPALRRRYLYVGEASD